MNLQELKFKTKPKLLISVELKQQIDFLHRKVKATEWSGVLFYNVTKGTVTDPSNMEITAIGMYLMDIGNSVYTEYSSGPKFIDALDEMKLPDNQAFGHIHTHHNMATFFSGQDKDELLDNAKNFNYYLSLIVNFDEKYNAKIAFESEGEERITIKNENFKEVTFLKPSKRVYTIDCDIEIVGGKEVPFNTKKVYADLVKENAKKALKVKKHTNGVYQQSFGSEFAMQKNAMISQYKKEEEETFEESALSMLKSIEIEYSDIEELTASIITKNLNNKLTLADSLDAMYKSYTNQGLKLSVAKQDEIDQDTVSFVGIFKEFSNVDFPDMLIHEAIQEILEDQKDQSIKPNKLFNSMIDEISDAVAYIETIES